MSKPARRASFIGQDGFIWWIGVVVDRNDPLMLGRCKIRIKGIHPENVSEVPNEDLPWSQPLIPVNTSNHTSTSLKEGDFVVGFFLDGEQGQYPIVMGHLPIIAEENPEQVNTGFADAGFNLDTRPTPIKAVDYKLDGSGAAITNEEPKIYPLAYDEPTTSRINRKENIDKTIIQRKEDSIVNVASKPKEAELKCSFFNFKGGFLDDLSNMAEEAYSNLMGAFAPILSIVDDIEAALDAAQQTLLELKDQAIQAITDGYNDLLEAGTKLKDQFMDEVSKEFDALSDSVSGTISDLLNSPCIKEFNDTPIAGVNFANIHKELNTPDFEKFLDITSSAVSEALPSDLSSLSDMSSLTADLTKSLNSLPPI